MILSTFQKTGRSAGGGPIGEVSEFLGFQERDFGSALSDFEVTVYSNPDIRHSDEGVLAKLRGRGVRIPHEVPLPNVVYRRSEKKLRIKWQTQTLSEAEMEDWSAKASHPVFLRAVQDVYEALKWGLNARLTNKDDFDVSACLNWIKEAETQAPSNDSDLQSLLSVRSEQYLHLIRTKNFHKKFDIDWNAMHKNAAYLLYHPDLWNDTDARMPHGNVLGKGILENFVYYEMMSVDDILTSLGLGPYQTSTSYDDKVKALQVELAFIFAHIKKRGTVPVDLTDALIRKMNIEAKNRNSIWVHRSRHGVGSHFAWMCNYLEGFTSLKRRDFP
ncbi:MAG: hypothetical protein ABJJ69_10380 [Paracoccaceae bacterium]